MTSATNADKGSITKFQALLGELFQLDCAELDFGIYRIMNHKRDAVDRFINENLPATVAAELDRGPLAQYAQAQAKLGEIAQKVRSNLGDDAIGDDGELADNFHEFPVGKEYLKAQSLAVGSNRSRVDVEEDIYNHLYAFFSRYYDEGDFISQRRYSGNQRYAIPYNGEEVYLHWANSDQYYVKTDEHFRNYDWQAPNGVTVRFRLKTANVEQNNVKSDKRFFLPVVADAKWDADARAVTIPVEYRLLNKDEAKQYSNRDQQKKINEAAAVAIPQQIGNAPDALAALAGERHSNGNGPVSHLMYHLRRYSTRNNADYFIHKDLAAFLNQELDFYLKNEFLNLNDLAADGQDAAEGWFQQLCLIKAVGGKIIKFLAQIEDFQKTLWEKRKFVTETQYCITLGNIVSDFYTDIISNEAQWTEWRELFDVDGTDRNSEFLQGHPTLVVDTKHFCADFTCRLLASIHDLDGKTDGLLVHGENWQALRLMQEKFSGAIRCIYIDPPYNTGQANDFIYKDQYQHSSWLSMMANGFVQAGRLMSPLGGILVSTDDGEYANLKYALGTTWGENNFVSDIIWNSRKSVSSDTLISTATNHTTFFAANKKLLDANKANFRLPHPGDKFTNPNNDPLGPWVLDPLDAPNVRENLTYTIVNESSGEEFLPPEGRCWRFEQPQTEKLLSEGRILFGRSGNARPQYKRYLSEATSKGMATTTLWDDVKTTTDGTNMLLAIFGDSLSRSIINKIKPKPTELVERCSVLLTNWDDLVLDYFAGSGTTGHAVINLNREDGGERKFILVEMGEYFDTVLLPRIKKVTFTPEWKDGKPQRQATAEEIERSPRIIKYIRLESYEDALDSIEFEPKTDEQASLESSDEYLLKYLLCWETKDSETLLNVAKLANPFTYRLLVHVNGERKERTVDLPETFNYLIGLNVRTRRAYDDGERRYLVYRGETRANPGHTVAVIWRATEDWTEKDFVQDRDFVETKNLRDGADVVYVNGDSCIHGAKSIEPVFKARMFSGVNA